MSRYYSPNGEPIDMETWAVFIESHNQVVAQTKLRDGHFVSTVYLGLDHNFSGVGPPLIYETMVFEPYSSRDLICHRYSTRVAALEGHDATVWEWKRLVSPWTIAKLYLYYTPRRLVRFAESLLWRLRHKER